MCSDSETCGLVIQIIIFILSGFDSAILIGLLFDDQTSGTIIFIVACLSIMLAVARLIKRESLTLCCKYWCYCPCYSCDTEIKSSKNVKSFWISYVDAAFDGINGLLLIMSVDTRYQFWVVIGTLSGVAGATIELASHFTEICGGFVIDNIQCEMSSINPITNDHKPMDQCRTNGSMSRQ
eukprot:340912_1